MNAPSERVAIPAASVMGVAQTAGTGAGDEYPRLGRPSANPPTVQTICGSPWRPPKRLG
jgi:hypothetical protein